jgi:general secretion pathway protein M
MTPRQTLEQARTQLKVRWAAIAPRERRLLQAALAIVVLALAWLVLVRPAWQTLRDAPARIDTLDLQLQQMQRLATETRELRSLPVVSATQSEAALRAATERLGPSAKLTLQGERATLNVTGVPGEALVAWLGEARSAARARPEEARLARGPTGYTGSVVVLLVRAG